MLALEALRSKLAESRTIIVTSTCCSPGVHQVEGRETGTESGTAAVAALRGRTNETKRSTAGAQPAV
jgi:hypothetical protein